MAWQAGETFPQYIPEYGPKVVTLRHTPDWPDATAVLTRPAVDDLIRTARRENATVEIVASTDRLYPDRVTITGTARVIRAIREIIGDKAFSPKARVAYHRTLDATRRDPRVKAIMAENRTRFDAI
ncbi:MAG: hypothetical protein FIB06_04570 [Betaproteobacteria bacterium]|nr:hypothetical protein [Betaproteobacteria bacterium]